MLEKILNEYKEKISSGDLDELLNAPIYGMIITYLQTEPIDKDWKDFLETKNNILEYLYEVFNRTRHTTYNDVKSALDFDQLSY